MNSTTEMLLVLTEPHDTEKSTIDTGGNWVNNPAAINVSLLKSPSQASQSRNVIALKIATFSSIDLLFQDIQNISKEGCALSQVHSQVLIRRYQGRAMLGGEKRGSPPHLC